MFSTFRAIRLSSVLEMMAISYLVFRARRASGTSGKGRRWGRPRPGLAVGFAVLQAVQAHGVAQAGVQDLVVGPVGLQDGLEAHDAEVVEELVDVQVVQVQPVLEDLQGGGAELEVDQGRVGVEGDDLSHGVQPQSRGCLAGGGGGFRRRVRRG